MKQTFLLLIALCFIALAIQSCKKSKEPEPDNPWGLPNATQEGSGLIACRVNGENWIIERSGWYNPIEIRFRDSILFFSQGFGWQKKLGVQIKSGDFKINESYSLDSSIGSFAYYSGNWANCSPPESPIPLRKSHDGEIILTKIDTNKKFVSGTFHFKIIIPDCDTLNVTDGRFDLRYN